MTLDCGTHLDACGFGITRIRELGVPGYALIAHTGDILKGWIVVSHDRIGKEPAWVVAQPDSRWASTKTIIGL